MADHSYVLGAAELRFPASRTGYKLMIDLLIIVKIGI